MLQVRVLHLLRTPRLLPWCLCPPSGRVSSSWCSSSSALTVRWSNDFGFCWAKCIAILLGGIVCCLAKKQSCALSFKNVGFLFCYKFLVFLFCFVFSVCVRGEFSDSRGGHVPRDLQERLPQRAADSGHVHHLLPHRAHHVYGGKTQLRWQSTMVPLLKSTFKKMLPKMTFWRYIWTNSKYLLG